MSHEVRALEDNGTWSLVHLPPRKKAIGSKWVYMIKYKSDGSIERYKSRLVILGNNQREVRSGCKDGHGMNVTRCGSRS